MRNSSEGVIKNDLQANLYTEVEVQWQGADDSSVRAVFSVPHFSMRGSYRAVLDYSHRPTLRLEDADYNFKRALFDSYK